MTRTLAIETSCDDTSIGIVNFDNNRFEVEKLLAYSQVTDHQKYGGVMPEVASRLHSEKIIEVLKNIGRDNIEKVDNICVTTHPGLPGSLVVGKAAANALAEWFHKPLLEVNHIHGHIFSLFLERDTNDFQFPMVVLTASGGHNDLYLIEEGPLPNPGFFGTSPLTPPLRGEGNICYSEIKSEFESLSSKERFREVSEIRGAISPNKEDIEKRGLVRDGKHFPYNSDNIEKAKQLRKNSTNAERKLWDNFLKKHEYKFYKQKPVDHFIADFFCSKKKLIIEVDGGIHNEKYQKEYDKMRSELLNLYGLHIIRFTNEEIDNNFDNVCKKINEHLKVSPLRGDLERSLKSLKITHLGKTLDDAAGECFDKVSRMLGGPYPGGPRISEMASKHPLPLREGLRVGPVSFKRIFLSKEGFDFSFSGMKSQVSTLLKNFEKQNIILTDNLIFSIAYEFQEAVVEVLAKKLAKAGLKYGAKTLGISGGVSANDRLWDYANQLIKHKNYINQNFSIFKPAKKVYSTDNAAMIGVAGIMKEMGMLN